METIFQSLPEHDRQVIPTSEQSHFLYRAATQPMSTGDMELVAKAVQELVEDDGIAVAEISLYDSKHLTDRNKPEAAAALTRLASQLGVDMARNKVCILVCEWARPHDDSDYRGSAFVSLVLSTGRYPYVLNMLHTRKSPGPRSQSVVSQTRLLKTGDVVVFDPTTPHMAAPARPHDSSLLVILQAELDLGSDEDMVRVLQKFPRHVDDKDDHIVFDPVLGCVD
jgi:hypothetical protein